MGPEIIGTALAVVQAVTPSLSCSPADWGCLDVQAAQIANKIAQAAYLPNVVSMFVGVGGVIVAAVAVRQTAAALTLQREATEREHRAYIHAAEPRFALIGSGLPGNTRIEFCLTLKNSGLTPGQVRHRSCNMRFAAGADRTHTWLNPTAPPPSPAVEILINPGAETPLRFSFDLIHITRPTVGYLRLSTIAYVEYSDFLGRIWRTDTGFMLECKVGENGVLSLDSETIRQSRGLEDEVVA